MSQNIAYVSQSAWVFSGTLKENVLFGQPYDREKYNKVIAACALDQVCSLLCSGFFVENCMYSDSVLQALLFCRISKIYTRVIKL